MSKFIDVKINETIPWRKKSWKRIQQNYSKGKYFVDLAPIFEKWLLNPAENIASQNVEFVLLVMDLLGINTEIAFSSEIDTNLKRSERVLAILKYHGADTYLSANGSFRYMLEDKVFPVDNIECLFQDFVCKEYQQVGTTKGFVPYLSVLDALFNIGKDGTLELIKNGTQKWLTWEDMADILLNK